MLSQNLRHLFEQPALVFDGINSSHREQQATITDLWKSGLRPLAVISAELLRLDAMRLNDDALVGELLAQQRSLAGITRQDRVRILKQPVRLEEQAKEFAPFPPMFERRIEIFSDILRQVQQTPVDGQHERHLPLSRNRSANSADAAQSMRMNQGDVLFPRQGRYQS